MTDDQVLFLLLICVLVLGQLLAIVSGIAMGGHISDLLYQVEARVNGIDRIQSLMDIRANSCRIALGLVFWVSALLALADTDVWARTWVARVLWIVVLVMFTAAAVLDRVDKWRQLRIQQAQDRSRSEG